MSNNLFFDAKLDFRQNEVFRHKKKKKDDLVVGGRDTQSTDDDVDLWSITVRTTVVNDHL